MNPPARPATDPATPHGKPGPYAGLRVIEIGDETIEHCGLLLAGLGAEVIKIEPPQGAPSRRIGPFRGDREDPEQSLHFWHYNRNKQSVVLRAGHERADLEALLEGADIVLDASAGDFNRQLGLDREAVCARYPQLVVGRMTPFGDTGPWKDYRGSDLVHLALGGVMMNCGYDPDPAGHYDLPPVAPQLWHAYHIAGEHLALGIAAALVHMQHSGRGQEVSLAIHDAVSKCTEVDLMSWVMRRATIYRQTCRHASEHLGRTPSMAYTKDGRWIMTWGVSARDEAHLIPFLERYGMAADLQAPASGTDLKARAIPGTRAIDERTAHKLEVIQRFIGAHTYANAPWEQAQAAGLLWAPVRKPHENASDEHWLSRGSFADVAHEDLGCSYRYAVSKWIGSSTGWQTGRRAPHLGEHSASVLATPRRRAAHRPAPARAAAAVTASETTGTAATSTAPATGAATTAAASQSQAGLPATQSVHGKPFPLQGIRILDFSWFLASAGGTRYAAALGAECFKIEWHENPDTRLAAMAPVGGRAARAAATAPLPGVSDPDMGGQFNNKNAGKRGLSLNIRHPEGLQIAKRLLALCDVVAEGFSPGVLERLGLGYDVMKSIRPDIIYVQQSGMGARGRYGRFRTVGPVAASFAGTTEMSGQMEPGPPAGWGYSYLDWIGAYGFALAIMSAIFHRNRTGEGQCIDSSQCEGGIFLTGPAVLDWSVNGRAWQRIGNRSPYKKAAPHGAYRCQGEDRWLAIACFHEAEWQALTDSADLRALRDDPRFATLAARLANQDALDAALSAWTTGQDAFDTMHLLQAAGVPAGVCQTAQDRCDHDPQLAALEWLTEVSGTKIGRWPVIEVPARLSETPAYAGGPIDRGAPCYGEDNVHVLKNLLGYSDGDIERLAREQVI